MAATTVSTFLGRWFPGFTSRWREAAELEQVKRKRAELERDAIAGAIRILQAQSLRGAYQDALEMTEALALAGAGLPMTREPNHGETVLSESAVSLKERFWELELALEDRGWQRQIALSALEFSRYGIQQLILITRLYAIKNPLIKRGVRISSYYVFGRGFEISIEDDTANQVLQEFLTENKSELGHLGMVEKDQTLRTDGNLFLVFFRRESDGQVQVRTIDAIEVSQVIADPNDASRPWFYQRSWIGEQFDLVTGQTKQESRRAWYPAIGYEPDDRPQTIGGERVMWESPVYHVKAGGLPKWKFGVPEEYAAVDWARAYRKFLENWASITEALARFAFTVETQGGAAAINNFSRTLSTTLGDGGTSIENNPPVNVASTFVSGPGNKVAPMRTAGATTEPEQGRRVMLMVSAADGLPETFYGDASTGSLATAQSLDRPTELQFLHRQELWREVLQKVCSYALAAAATAPGGKLREAEKPAPAISAIKVFFPAVLEHDIAAMVGAIVNGTTLDGKTPAGTIDIKTAARLILRELGVEDFETVVEAMYPEDGYDADQTVAPTEAYRPAKADRIADAVARLLEAAKRHDPGVGVDGRGTPETGGERGGR